MSEAEKKTETSGKAIWDIVNDYFKGRIETPFIVAFVTSWLVINRNLIFFLVFYKQPDKYTLLSAWDFSKATDFFGLFTVSDAYARNLILPALYASFFSIVIHPIELLTGAIRYLTSSTIKALAETCKNIYSNINPFFDLHSLNRELEKKNKTLQIEIDKSENRKEQLERKIAEYEDLDSRYKHSFISEMKYKALSLRHEIGEENLEFTPVYVLGYDCKIEIQNDKGEQKQLFFDQFLDVLVESGEQVYAFKIARGDSTLGDNNNLRANGKPLFIVNSIHRINHPHQGSI